MEYKALVLKEGSKYQEFMVYITEIGEWGTCDAPELYPMTCTLEGLKAFYPNSNWDDITLVTVKLDIMKNN